MATVKRWAAIVAVIAVAAVGLRAAGLTRANNSTLPARNVHRVLTQVRKSFGDKRLVRAELDGSTLHVVATKAGAGGGQKSEFEAQVLAGAVRDWMRSQGQRPIERLDVGGPGFSRRTDAIPNTPTGPSLRLDACTSAARRSIRDAWSDAKLTSVKWLPYLHGMCLFRLQSVPGYPVAAVPQAALDVAQHLLVRMGAPNSDSSGLFFEVDDPHGRPLTEIGRLPGKCSMPWVRPDLPSPFAERVLYTGLGQCAHG